MQWRLEQGQLLDIAWKPLLTFRVCYWLLLANNSQVGNKEQVIEQLDSACFSLVSKPRLIVDRIGLSVDLSRAGLIELNNLDVLWFLVRMMKLVLQWQHNQR